MKNKPLRHKEYNTFKFKPFAERISDIDVDIFHRIGHEYESQSEENTSSLYQAVENWTNLNLTEGFDAFKKELKAHRLLTLPQLILDKDRVVEVLLKHIKLKNPLCLQPLLEIVVALAKDLRKDFYPYYKEFLKALIELLNTKNTEQLEWTFTCLAHIFKFLWRPFLKDITTVFNTLLPLLSHNYPDYINNFACGSFAFVARKVKDWPGFLLHILSTVEAKKDGVEGCGKLFFEVVHGVQGQFHSCAQTNLPFLLESLADSKYPQNTLFSIIESMLENILQNIDRTKSQLWWDCLLHQLEVNTNNLPVFDMILKLMGQSIEFKSGKFVENPSKLVDNVTKMFELNLPESTLKILTQITILLLLSRHVKLTQEQASRIVRKVLSVPYDSIFLYFVENVFEFSSFEALVLPNFLKRCVSSNLSQDSLRVLTKLILKKSPLCFSGIELNNWKQYSLDFKDKTIENLLLNQLNIRDFDHYVSFLICSPHLGLDSEKIVPKLIENIDFYLNAIKNHDQLNKNLFLLNLSIECLIHFNGTKWLVENFDRISEHILPFVSKIQHLNALKTLDLIVSAIAVDSDIINKSTLVKLHKYLEENFSSPHHELRLFTSHIYTFFEALPEFQVSYSSNPDIPKETFQIFTICYRVESIESQVDTYREQIKHLEKFYFDKPQMLMCVQTEWKTIPLRYLCGCLYMNFKLLWEPVIKILISHGHGLKIDDFWRVFGDELKKIVDFIRNDSNAEEKSEEVDSVWRELYENSMKLRDKPDFSNYRILLWKAMAGFSDIAEAKTRDVSELLLDFFEKEYTRNNSDAAQKWNIKQNTADVETDHPEGTEEEAKTETKSLITRKSSLRALLHFLPIFTRIRSPRSMYREPELNKLYHELLQHKNAQVQKFALDCILTYKPKYLLPYKDNLYNLIDDKKFKNEITAFRIDTDNESIQKEHRNELIPIVLSIVFSKMTSKTGLRTGRNKSSGQFRRGLILRFLAGCEKAEMFAFVKMSLRFYARFLDDDVGAMIAKITATLNLENFIAPKRLLSTLNLINVILQQFGGLMSPELLTFILQIVIVIGTALKIAFDNLESVHSGYNAILRTLRGSCLSLLEHFFEHFTRYEWNNQQINALFNIFIWPYLPKLNIEGIHSPTNLLKLFLQWGSNPRYFKLLVKKDEDHVLPHVIQLLLNERSQQSVVNAIEEMLENLLKLQPDEEDLKLDLPIDNLVPIEANVQARGLNYGSSILLPHIGEILLKCKQKLQTKKGLNQRELFILSRISELVWEDESCDNTLTLLLPVVQKRIIPTIGEETVIQLLTTVNNLLGNVVDPKKHLRNICPLFESVSYPNGRKLLITILRTVCAKSPDISEAIALMEGLNAFDAKWIDQPDYQRRQEAFKSISDQQNSKLDLELGVMVIYNCYFFLNEKDLSLKEHSAHCLKSLCVHLIKNCPSKDLDYLINAVILNLIRKGMKSRNEDLRNSCIQLLGHLSRECPESNVVFRDLEKYCSSTDPEVDFCENLTHLQLHRHARALGRFVTISKELTASPNARTLTQFVLPLASFYLFNEKYAGKNSIVDAAIETIGVVARVLPWHQYEALLKFYLDKLKKIEHQKQLVRIIVLILDSFHFDLSKGQVESTVQETKQEIAQETSQDALTPQETKEEVEVTPEEVKDQESGDVTQVDEALDITDAENDEDINETNKEVKISEKITCLCKSTATRVTNTFQSTLLPKLHKALAQLTQHDTSHKVNRKKTGFEREEEDLSRVPISLALVKLLQRLPKEILDANLSGIFIKLCTFLKSRLESVRRVARDVLQKIMQSLGPDYLGMLLSEMQSLLNRGYQVHVLVYTVHSILNCLKDRYKPADLDKILLTVLKLCQADLFGTLSEEKEVVRIAVKTSEAKSTKSFDTLQILAQFITDKCLLDLVMPLKHALQTHSFKTTYKAEQCLRHIALGLVENSFVSTESLLIFAYGTASESIPELSPAEKKEEPDRTKTGKVKTDCFIIPKAPVGRAGIRVNKVKSSHRTNAHLMIEFGVRLCLVLLKRDKVKEDRYKPLLDPFVEIFKKCLNSKHVKLSTLTMQCLSWIMKYELPSMQNHIEDICKDIFAILHKYAAAGLSKGDNFDLVLAAFKAMSVVVRDVDYYSIDTDQLKILLLYVEQDMHDHDRQATAFALLKAIVKRKLIIPEIHEVMSKVAELSITAELSHVRAQSRAVFHQYLMDYPLGSNLEKHLAFYTSQMEYDMQYGRESAIEMISHLITSFPLKMLKEHAGSFLVTLGARLVNDEVPECRKMVAQALTTMLSRLTKKEHDPLFDIVILWFKDRKRNHRQLAAQLCGIFVTIERASFETRLPKLLPHVLKQFHNEKFANDDEDKARDHHLFQVVQMLLKLCSLCPAFLKRKEVEDLGCHVQNLLGYPHDWVRLSAAQFMGHVLSKIDVEALAALLSTNQKGDSGYLIKNPEGVKALTLDLCDQLQPGHVKSNLAEQVVKNLVFIARVLSKVPEHKFNLLWLVKRMRKIVNTEVVETPSEVVLRTAVFKWIAGVATVLNVDELASIFPHLLAPLVREMVTTEESNAPLRQLAKEVGGLLKKKVGMEVYGQTLTSLQRNLSVRRAKRKSERTQLAVTDPELFAQKKMKRHDKKKVLKKRKLEELKGNKRNFKRRKTDIDLEPTAEL